MRRWIHITSSKFPHTPHAIENSIASNINTPLSYLTSFRFVSITLIRNQINPSDHTSPQNNLLMNYDRPEQRQFKWQLSQGKRIVFSAMPNPAPCPASLSTVHRYISHILNGLPKPGKMPITLPTFLCLLVYIKFGGSHLHSALLALELSHSSVWKELCRHHATRFSRLALPVGILGRCLEA